jgi:serine/threonine protein kinase
LNSENILVKFDKKSIKLDDVKIIDFGTSIHFNELDKITGITLEYLPPEVLDFIY